MRGNTSGGKPPGRKADGTVRMTNERGRGVRGIRGVAEKSIDIRKNTDGEGGQRAPY